MPHTNQTDARPVTEIDPTDVVAERVVNLLTPAFLIPARGDEDLARAAAFRALCDYYDNTPGDLLTIGQTILLGLATIEAAGRALAPGVSDATFLRLTGRANTLARSEARARKAMLEHCIPRCQPTLPDWSAVPERLTPEPDSEAAAPDEVPADVSEPDRTPYAAATVRPALPDTLRSRALRDVSHNALIGAHPADIGLPQELQELLATAGFDWAALDRAAAAFTAQAATG